MPLRTVRTTKHLALAVSLSVTAWIAGGCNFPQSVNPFYRSQDVVSDPSLVGEWQNADPSDKGGLLIKEKTADSFTIESTYYDEDQDCEASWTFEAHEFSYRQDSYLDFFPTDFHVRGNKENFHTEANGMLFLVPVHSVMRLHMTAKNFPLRGVRKTG